MFVHQISKTKEKSEREMKSNWFSFEKPLNPKIYEREFPREQKMAKLLFVSTSKLNLLRHMLMFAASGPSHSYVSFSRVFSCGDQYWGKGTSKSSKVMQTIHFD